MLGKQIKIIDLAENEKCFPPNCPKLLIILFFCDILDRLNADVAKYSQGQRGRSPTKAVGSARADAHAQVVYVVDLANYNF